jgi:hypothetical protein
VKKNKNTDVLFELVRAGLWEKEARLSSLEGADWEDVYQLASEQSMLGLVLAGLENCNAKPPQELLLEWIGEVQMLEQQNKAMNGFVVELFDRLFKAGISAVLVKGQGVAQYYERPLWRCCGDIDLLMDSENYRRAKDLLIPLADHIESEDKRKKHQGLYIGESLIELHGAMPFELSKKVDDVLEEVIVKANTDNTNCTDDLEGVAIPKANEHVVLVFTHFLHHFFIEGVGLRQICDWCRLLWCHRSELDLRLLESRIKRMGLLSEWKSFASLAVDYLGMPEEAMPFYDSRFKKRGSRIMEHVMETGNFGHNKDLSYRAKYSGLAYKMVALWRRFIDFCSFVWIFPLDSPRFFVSYVMRKV